MSASTPETTDRRMGSARVSNLGTGPVGALRPPKREPPPSVARTQRQPGYPVRSGRALSEEHAQLTAPTTTAHQDHGSTPPVIVVGMPRSGSTLLVRLLNESPDLVVVNDLYFLQEVDATRGSERPGRMATQSLCEWLLDRIKDRTNGTGSREFVRSLALSRSEIQTVEKRARAELSGEKHWSEILTVVLQAVAREEGKSRWGYNTPQDYLHLDRLREAFPGAQFVFLLRSPDRVMASYKFNRDPFAGPNRYHPVLQSVAWRLCARTYLDERAKGASDILLVRYEDLVADTESTLRRIGLFLNAPLEYRPLEGLGNNSSYRGSTDRRLSGLETWLCRKIASPVATELGYEIPAMPIRSSEFWGLLFCTCQSGWFHLWLALRSANARARILKVVRQWRLQRD